MFNIFVYHGQLHFIGAMMFIGCIHFVGCLIIQRYSDRRKKIIKLMV